MNHESEWCVLAITLIACAVARRCASASAAGEVRGHGRGRAVGGLRPRRSRLQRAKDSGLFSTSSRILRFYYYQMRGDFRGTNSFDSGLLSEGRNLRGNYATYRCRTENGPTAGCS